MTGLFLRYCWRCNSTQTVVTAKGTCGGCGEKIGIVDAHALVPALGGKLDEAQRRGALDGIWQYHQPEGA